MWSMDSERQYDAVYCESDRKMREMSDIIPLKQGETGVLKGICHTKSRGDQFQALVSGSEEFFTPGGLIIYDQIVDVNPSLITSLS